MFTELLIPVFLAWPKLKNLSWGNSKLPLATSARRPKEKLIIIAVLGQG
jgi:hypothetical protein